MNLVKKSIYSLDNIIFKLVRLIIFIAITTLIVSVLVQVIGRYIFKVQPRWTTELSCFMLVYSVFLGAAVALRNGGHVALDISKIRMPKVLSSILGIIRSLSIYVFIAVSFYYGLKITMSNVSSLSEAMKIPYAWVYGVLPVSSILMALGYTTRLLHATDSKPIEGGTQ